MTALERELNGAIEILPGRLYWVALSGVPQSHQQGKSFFCIDNDLIYWNFFLDFGPLNLGHLYRYCALLNAKLSEPKLKDRVIYHYCGNHPHRRANSAFLIAAWSIMYLNRSPDDAYKPFNRISPPFPPWHDATPSICSFNLTVLDTLRGLNRARECGFFDFTKFDIDEYEHYEQVENGDLNWTLGNKFVAFAGPHATRESHPGGYTSLCPEDYLSYFKRKNVKLVVRLNKKYYDAKKFTQNGIDHMELYFLDGSNPPDHLLAKFLAKVESTDGCVAVHCKAGLGRTGCVIGCYMMKHYQCTAEEVIGWLRIARPGSIIGPQQQWLKEMQTRMWREGELFRQKRGIPAIVPCGAAASTQKHKVEPSVGANGRPGGPGASDISGAERGVAGMTLSGSLGAGARDGRESQQSEGKVKSGKETQDAKTQGDYLRQRRMQAAQELAQGHTDRNGSRDKEGTGTGPSSRSPSGSSVSGTGEAGKEGDRFGKFLSTWSK